MEDAFSRPIGQVLANFNVDPKAGLSDKQITEQRRKHGRNGEF
jgi:Ca2+ transporting ATPase